MHATAVLPLLNQIIRNRLIEKHVASDDRREFPRYSATFGVRCRHVNEDLETVGDEFDAVTHDISEGGVSLITDRPIKAGYLSVVFSDREQLSVEVVVDVTRTREYGELYMAAGPFIDL